MDDTSNGREPFDLEALRRRDPPAVADWFDAFSDAVYAFVFYRVGRDRELAADVTQDTFLTALRTIQRYDPQRGAMFPWLTYIARNAARKAHRRSSRYESLDALWASIDVNMRVALEHLDDRRLPDELVERNETAELVRVALSQLPPAYRQSIEEHYFRERPLGETARRAGTTEGAAKVRLHRARLAFKAAFESMVAALVVCGAARRQL